MRLEIEADGNEMTAQLIDAMKAMIDGLEKFNAHPSVKEQLEEALNKPNK